MGFKVRKSYKFGPAKINVSKSGVGYSVGGKGFRYTKKAGGGYRTTASIPGTGLSYSKDYSSRSNGRESSVRSQDALNNKTQKRSSKNGTFRIVLGVIYILWAIFGLKANVVHTVIACAVGVACICWGISARKKKQTDVPKTELQEKFEALSSEEFEEYKETLLRFIKENRERAEAQDMKTLIQAVREESERRQKQQ